VVIPAEIRVELADHARAEAPNEACGLIVLRDGRAERYVRGRNTLASPYRFQLDVDPDAWFLEDEGFELAVFHTHPETAPVPSRTDLENVGLWAGKPYVIYSLARDELAAGTINDGAAQPLSVRDQVPGRGPGPGP
jgi:[CysO sulfur-carrier protein]-S-L-cysteine hydrolase